MRGGAPREAARAPGLRVLAAHTGRCKWGDRLALADPKCAVEPLVVSWRLLKTPYQEGFSFPPAARDSKAVRGRRPFSAQHPVSLPLARCWARRREPRRPLVGVGAGQARRSGVRAPPGLRAPSAPRLPAADLRPHLLGQWRGGKRPGRVRK